MGGVLSGGLCLDTLSDRGRYAATPFSMSLMTSRLNDKYAIFPGLPSF